MTITKVKYEKLFPTGAYLNEKIGFEADIDFAFNLDAGRNEPMETPEQAIDQLRRIAENIHKEKYPHLYTESGSPVEVKQVREETIDKRVAEIINDLNQCTEIHSTGQFGVEIGLIAYEDAANSNPEIKAAYDLKYKQLSK